MQEEMITCADMQDDASNFKDEASRINFEKMMISARRTAFVARFIVLREGKRTKAHRVIENMSWDESTTAEQVSMMFRQAFIENGDNMAPVDRDIRRALDQTKRSLKFFVAEYAKRSTLSFVDALWDYERSNTLLFGEDENPRSGGWRMPSEIEK